MQLFDGHVATIKVIIIEINVNCFLVKKISNTISSHLNYNVGATAVSQHICHLGRYLGFFKKLIFSKTVNW